MRYLGFIGAVTAALLTATPALAAGKTRHPRVLVLDLPTDKAIAPNTAKSLNDFLAGAVRDQGFTVITGADIAAVLGVERQKQLLGCSEDGCLAEIGGSMGVDLMVRGSLSVLGARTALSLTLIDAKGVAVNEQRRMVKSTDPADLIQALEEMVPVLVAPVRPVDTSPTVSMTPAPASGGLSTWLRPSSYVLVGAGGVALACGLGFGLEEQGTVGKMTTQATINEYHSAAESQATASRVATGVGVGLAVVGVALFVYSVVSGSGASPSAATGGAPAVALQF